VPQFATVGLGAGFRDDGASGTQEEPAGFRRNLRAWNVLGYSGVKAMRRAGSLNPMAAQLLQLFEQPFEDVDSQAPRPDRPGLQHVGAKQKAEMAGNFAEWCWDWYGTPYGQPTTTNPTGPPPSSLVPARVLRGGSCPA
jgi:hypothetical protein